MPLTYRPSALALILCAFLLLSPARLHAAQPSAPDATLQFGGNVNERLHWLLPPILVQTHTTWVRGFVPASEFLSGKRSYQTDPGILRLKEAAASGHKVILSIKWDCAGKGQAGPVPSPDSAREHDWFHFVDSLLETTSGSLSMLVLNNELYIDTQPQDLIPGKDGQIAMVRFLQRLAAHIGASHPKAQDGSPLLLYVGGFTRLDFKRNQDNPATAQMCDWINRDPLIAGADFHLHQPDMATTEQALDFVRTKIPIKPLIVTEFSLVWKWKKHLPDAIGAGPQGAAFAKQYGLSPRMTVMDFCNHAFAAPVSEAEWRDFLASQPWFEANYLDEIGPSMQKHGIIVATYALTLNPLPKAGAAPFQIHEDMDPWFFNQLLMPGVAFVPGNTRLPENYGFFDNYVHWQEAKSGQ